MIEKPQKTQKQWEKEYSEGLYSPRDLWDAGFRPRSNKYRHAVKEWKYYKKYYSVTLTLDPEEYEELKMCPYDVELEEEEEKERAEYDRICYLLAKYGGAP